jgi:hypothetical protein
VYDFQTTHKLEDPVIKQNCSANYVYHKKIKDCYKDFFSKWSHSHHRLQTLGHGENIPA